MLGAIEGRVTHCATATSWASSVATFLIGLGRATGRAPAFTKAFRSFTPRQFFRFSHELETTAKEGYVRIHELLASLEQTNAVGTRSTGSALKLGLTAPYEFAKTLAEECFHAAVFEQLEAWLEPDGQAFTAVPANDAVLYLRALAIEHLSLGSRNLGPAALGPVNRAWLKSADNAVLVSHGGLGELFAEYGVNLPLVTL
jgi:hypothetical protein